MPSVIRIVCAGIILVGGSHLSPARPAHIVPIDRASDVANAAPSPGSTCPLRAWPYIG
ncbi:MULTISPECIES: hypothetical protein [Methylobacterium]|uniref:hypothetical protein n=1 Tax=Methylobacterium TaxID=407 RepID=UPI0013ECD864|nr:hypothetical protein [Methylobacterium sp. DB0501]NGM37747.1 hypothetical protein [Methylobacterium sp. DB0501]